MTTRATRPSSVARRIAWLALVAGHAIVACTAPPAGAPRPTHDVATDAAVAADDLDDTARLADIDARIARSGNNGAEAGAAWEERGAIDERRGRLEAAAAAFESAAAAYERSPEANDAPRRRAAHASEQARRLRARIAGSVSPK